MRIKILQLTIALLVGVSFGNIWQANYDNLQSQPDESEIQRKATNLNIYTDGSKLIKKLANLESKALNPNDDFSKVLVVDFEKLQPQAWKEKYFRTEFHESRNLKNLVNTFTKIFRYEDSIYLIAQQAREYYHAIFSMIKGEIVDQEFSRVGKNRWIKEHINSYYKNKPYLHNRLNEAKYDLENRTIITKRAEKWEMRLDQFGKNQWWFNYIDEPSERFGINLAYLKGIQHVELFNHFVKTLGFINTKEIWKYEYLKWGYTDYILDIEINKWLNRIKDESNLAKQGLIMHDFFANLSQNKLIWYSYNGGYNPNI